VLGSTPEPGLTAPDPLDCGDGVELGLDPVPAEPPDPDDPLLAGWDFEARISPQVTHPTLRDAATLRIVSAAVTIRPRRLPLSRTDICARLSLRQA
jgi:hypothetical protein